MKIIITSQTLQDSGYNRCLGTVSNFKQFASNLFQKRVKNNQRETLYFINVYEFDFTGLRGKDHPDLSYQADVRFYRSTQQFNTELLFLENTSIEEMENFFKEVFESMKCDIDQHNN